jgi:hypothetical protein
MLFKPSTVACSWDTWLYYKDGTHYLFYLFNSRADAYWDGLGLATSPDGVHFTDHGPIIHKSDDAVWLGTGMTWEVEGKYYLNFSEFRAGTQEVHFAESEDLLHWQRLPDEEYVCRLDPRWYAQDPTLSPQRWDCIWVLPEENGKGYIGYLTAVASQGPKGLCGTAGFVTSPDGKHFQAEPPVIETGFWGDGLEVGAVERVDGRYYMLLGVFHAPLGGRSLARLPGGECGMYVATSQVPRGPFRIQPGQPLLLGSSPSVFTYFARFYRFKDELLVNHHSVARTTPHVGMNAGPDVMFAPLKKAYVDENGSMSLRWWLGNEALKGRYMPVHLDECSFSRALVGCHAEDCRLTFSAAANAFAYLPAHFDIEHGVVLEAEVTLAETNGPLSSVGLFIEGQPSGTGSVVLTQSDGRLTVGPWNGYNFKAEDSKPFTIQPGQMVRWRILLRGPYMEIYLDDVHVQSYTINHRASGKLGWVVESGTAHIAALHSWEMTF